MEPCVLSPGDYWKDVPLDLEGNLRFRAALLERCRRDPKARESVLHMCREDIIFWIAAFGWQYNPRKKSRARVRPFIPWDFQIEAMIGRNPQRPGILYCIDESEDLVIEKSRDMGISYELLYGASWQFLFHANTAVLAISRSADAVEKSGDHKSLFWKVDFILDHQPKWLLGGYDKENKDHRQKMLFAHPNGSTITGEASTGQSGVGGRATWMLIDEFSQFKDAREVYRRTAGTSDCRIFCGTHKGTGTMFHELTDLKSEAGSQIKKLCLHWTQHPGKNKGLYHWSKEKHRIVSLDPDYQYPPEYQFVRDGKPVGGPRPGVRSPWYDRECKRIGDERGVAEDLDINPEGSVSQVFDAGLIRDLIEGYAREPVWRGDLEHDWQGKPLALKPDPKGKLKLWVHPNEGKLPEGLYAIGADISEGVGATPTCFAAANAVTGEKILEWESNRTDPMTAAVMFTAIARALRNPETGEGAFMVWEMQGPGKTFGLKIIELGYRRVFFRSAVGKLADKTPKNEPGWYPSPDAKDILLREYQIALRDRKFSNPSEPSLKECLSFQLDATGHAKHSSEAQPKDGHHAAVNHGDHVVADALCWLGVAYLDQLSVPGMKEPPKVAPVNSLLWRRERRERMLSETDWR